MNNISVYFRTILETLHVVVLLSKWTRRRVQVAHQQLRKFSVRKLPLLRFNHNEITTPNCTDNNEYTIRKHNSEVSGFRLIKLLSTRRTYSGQWSIAALDVNAVYHFPCGCVVKSAVTSLQSFAWSRYALSVPHSSRLSNGLCLLKSSRKWGVLFELAIRHNVDACMISTGIWFSSRAIDWFAVTNWSIEHLTA